MDEYKYPRETRLSRELQEAVPRNKVTPIDAFNLARRKWLKSERIEIGALAEELGISRATLFRWVGSRELLIGEVMGALFDGLWDMALQTAQGSGADYAADLSYKLMQLVLAATPLSQFIERDPEYALRVLTSKTSTVQTRIVTSVEKALSARIEAGEILPMLKVDDLAFMIVRIVESCVYSDQITGRKRDIDVARDAIRILVAARADA